MPESFGQHKLVSEARNLAEQGLSMIETLHLGPLDYNVAQAADYLRTAAELVERFGREQARKGTVA